ncbi:MAG: YbjN domain-containing protein [Ilumatobacteraceae bacterium]
MARAVKGMLGVVADVLVADGRPFQVQSDGQTLQFEFAAADVTWRCFVRVLDERIVLVYSQLPQRVLRVRRAAVIELITRLNYELPLGNLEMDLADGEVRFRTSIDIVAIALDQDGVRQLLHTNVTETGRLLPAIEAVADGRAAPATAADLARQ